MSITAPRTPVTDLSKYPRFAYSRVTHELYRVDVDLENQVVIVGDPDNGCYEWMIRTPQGIERHSDVGYGDSAIAMRDGLIAYFGLPDGPGETPFR